MTASLYGLGVADDAVVGSGTARGGRLGVGLEAGGADEVRTGRGRCGRARQGQAFAPPSTVTTVPLIMLAAGLARKATASAISRGSA